ncbi:hypothetical protein BvCmsNSNP020_04650 [Escherichia coli]|nr:hypothetical protein BvCmsNSNP020_04650 [Escherichia coli]
MEYTPNKGLHIHFIGYLDGQRHKKSYRISRQLGDIWRRITEGDGYFHLCRAKDKYPVRIDHVIHYSDKSAAPDRPPGRTAAKVAAWASALVVVLMVAG